MLMKGGFEMNRKTKALCRLSVCALFSAVLCVISPIAIPILPIPFSLSLLVVLLAAAILGPVGGTASVLVYLLIGSLGLPVFGGGMGGFGVLLGPTGGFLWSYLPMSLLYGLLYRFVRSSATHSKQTEKGRILFGALASLPSLLICYIFGAIQYMLVARVSFGAAIVICILPFVLFDLIKLLLVSFLAERMERIAVLRQIQSLFVGKKS